jgi:hypothetical protein
MYGFCSKLVCLPESVELTDNNTKTLALTIPKTFKVRKLADYVVS